MDTWYIRVSSRIEESSIDAAVPSLLSVLSFLFFRFFLFSSLGGAQNDRGAAVVLLVVMVVAAGSSPLACGLRKLSLSYSEYNLFSR